MCKCTWNIFTKKFGLIEVKAQADLVKGYIEFQTMKAEQNLVSISICCPLRGYFCFFLCSKSSLETKFSKHVNFV